MLPGFFFDEIVFNIVISTPNINYLVYDYYSGRRLNKNKLVPD